MNPSDGLTLCIDGATSYLALALVRRAEALGSTSEDVGRAHSAVMIASLGALLERAGIEASDVARLVVGIGPGSYTGVRVAVATAKGLARAWGVPLHGASSLLALAGSQVAPGEDALAVADARRGNVYAQHVRRLASEPDVLRYEEVEGPRKLRRDSLATEFPGLRLVEGAQPDAAALAWAARVDQAAEPYYL
ncbi:MAG: tRNA (adenosine(37)-N6)-threonylcarbamoyltransferase complex dimerization subunit type 1 TsaB [Trueperaceae bacterium]|jgi:tRNA threonylcarbamoyl adenosine modification protein YeaZ|nr:tRNA (adenosine(37)-N6)-threonylcarbamoyltransferase complex dimerization subunit type 1 TsaB [Truepera sp.]HRN18330.1 tRNA (adenosine(37)-N6)-threonylcarbamoyltransferase complex dimerization subunit type 1 TsaB [Trueperaceae bacterium]HRQ09897.1 tRNA (adenosine(37)-N6)-threonylcarbamoyltransferase complex dimerization subunit type 1 TsaB [Trueperaceae bacterium]